MAISPSRGSVRYTPTPDTPYIRHLTFLSWQIPLSAQAYYIQILSNSEAPVFTTSVLLAKPHSTSATCPPASPSSKEISRRGWCSNSSFLRPSPRVLLTFLTTPSLAFHILLNYIQPIFSYSHSLRSSRIPFTKTCTPSQHSTLSSWHKSTLLKGILSIPRNTVLEQALQTPCQMQALSPMLPRTPHRFENPHVMSSYLWLTCIPI